MKLIFFNCLSIINGMLGTSFSNWFLSLTLWTSNWFNLESLTFCFRIDPPLSSILPSKINCNLLYLSFLKMWSKYAVFPLLYCSIQIILFLYSVFAGLCCLSPYHLYFVLPYHPCVCLYCKTFGSLADWRRLKLHSTLQEYAKNLKNMQIQTDPTNYTVKVCLHKLSCEHK